jgi:hypothetical protein
MPARDHAITPHFTSTSSPAHEHSTQLFSPTSSSFSVRTNGQVGSPSESPGYLNQVLRRVSRAGVDQMDGERDEERGVSGSRNGHVKIPRGSWDANEE